MTIEKKILLNFKPVTRIWKKKRSADKKLKNNKKTNCPKCIDIQLNKRRNKVGAIRAWRHVILSFIHVSHSNDMTSWLSNLAENVSCNVVTSCNKNWNTCIVTWITYLTFTCPKSLIFPKSLFLGFSNHPPRMPTSYLSFQEECIYLK
jgi:hypothetical protein